MTEIGATAMIVALAAVSGALLGVLVACIPALHIYNVMGLMAVAAARLPGWGSAPAIGWIVPFAVAMIAAWAIANAVPAILLSAPDESALFTVLPGQRFLMARRGYEAVLLTAIGGAGGIALVMLAAPLAPSALPVVHVVLAPHYHWIVWAVICFMLMSEWPKSGTAGLGPWRRLAAGWSNTGPGLLTFLLSGLLGFLMFYRSPLPVGVAFQNLMPVFAGLFALPWLVFNLVSRLDIPPQHIPRSLDLPAAPLLRGIGTGALGGAFAAFIPVVSGGIGAMLAGHAASTRDERTFLIAQGASKSVYYAGGLMLLFVPGLQRAHGGGAAILKGLGLSAGPHLYAVALAAVALAVATALLLLPLCTRGAIGLAAKVGYRRLSAAALALIVLLVAAMTGWAGLLVMLVAAGIGLIPVLFDSRRMNCLGVILLPVACNMSGAGPAVARALGLL